MQESEYSERQQQERQSIQEPGVCMCICEKIDLQELLQLESTSLEGPVYARPSPSLLINQYSLTYQYRFCVNIPECCNGALGVIV